MRTRLKRLIFLAPVILLVVLVFVAIGGVIVMELWNWLMPPLFGWHEIAFWQALGVLALCRILFGGVGFKGPVGSNVRRRMDERCQQMTPEERERFRQRMRERWGFGPSSDENDGQ